MPVLFAVTVLFIMQLAGEVLARLTGLPLPGPLIGMLLMLAALMAHGRVPSGLRDTCHHMLKHLMLLFIPPVAGIMLYFGPLEREWIPFLLACIAGVALTLVVTALTFRWMLRRAEKPRP
ncbi:CidA/LrgA family protein [Pusillimonas sp. SM2304]|uniref:CidA/LrgA family protein n=1 Tax=Pusillimonas sp. SM2304 TaxID=3073241 RepID=UPI0028748B59|nr:CidA/LrgA family protein [Pusillimonas sp. SM2304]MDS1141419.1 CidA/LrgA family protein [Pusillimonas sp. SM2304]